MSAPFALDFLSRRPFRDLHPRFLAALRPLADWPAHEQYDALARQVPMASDAKLPRFVQQNRELVTRCGGYEEHVAKLSAVPTRPGNWHDFFNMVVWAHFPKLRWALNALHVDPKAGPKDPRNGRAPAQNLAATLDEAGMLVTSTSPQLLTELQALRFKRVFWDMRAELLETTQFWLVGHGMLESLLTPHTALAARSLLLRVPSHSASDDFRWELDARAAAHVQTWPATRPVLDIVPLLAIPGYSDNDSAAYYDDPSNIRFDPLSRRPAATGELG
jgi:Protein of unknown function (DUF3025)